MIGIVKITSPESDAKQAVTNLKSSLDTGRFAVIMPLDDASVWTCDQASRSTHSTVIGATGHVHLALNKRLQMEAAVQLDMQKESLTSHGLNMCFAGRLGIENLIVLFKAKKGLGLLLA